MSRPILDSQRRLDGCPTDRSAALHHGTDARGRDPVRPTMARGAICRTKAARTSNRNLSLTIFALALASGLAASPTLAQEHSGHAMPAPSSATVAAPGNASNAYMAAMQTMDAAMASMPMTGQPGLDYARMMIPHHQSAIDMAKAYLASGETDPVLTKLSNDVVASQQAEIATLQAWIARFEAK